MEKCLFAFNPHSGKRKIKEDKIRKILEGKFEVETLASQYPGHIGEVISNRGSEFDIIVGGGGDGTINEIVNAIMHLTKKPRLAILPTGTVNDIAHSLGIPKNIEKAAKLAINGRPFLHDVMKAGERYCLYVCCTGLFTDASYLTSGKTKQKVGKIAYVLQGAKKIFSSKATKLKLHYDGGEVEGKFAIFIANNSRYTAGMKINKNAILNDGLVDVVMVECKKDKIRLSEVAKVINLFLRGITHFEGKKGVIHLKLKEFYLTLPNETPVNLDGEGLLKGDVHLSVLKEALEVLTGR